MPPAPLILTLAFHPDDQARFEALRREHFPPDRNLVPAHLTLFHHLPGEHEAHITDMLAAAASRQAPFPLPIRALRSLGRGVAFEAHAQALSTLRASLAQAWHEWLSAQDRQSYRAHVTIQNKASPDAARTLLAAMQAAFAPFEVRAQGLLLWRYLGGPWEAAGAFSFTGTDPGA